MEHLRIIFIITRISFYLKLTIASSFMTPLTLKRFLNVTLKGKSLVSVWSLIMLSLLPKYSCRAWAVKATGATSVVYSANAVAALC